MTPRSGSPTPDAHVPDGVRLQKVLAGAGLGSRRACEDLIAAGRVSVGGAVVRELGMRVDPATAVVHVDGLRLQLDPTLVTLALHKPVGVVSTMRDPHGRPSLEGYVADRSERLFHVGRLDAETSGLLLLTNDGDLAHRLTHPSYEVPKRYVATVEGRVERGLVRRLKAGVDLEDGPVRVGRGEGSRDEAAVLDRGTRAPRGPQPHRSTPPRGGGPPGDCAGAHPGGTDPARHAAAGADARDQGLGTRRADVRRGAVNAPERVRVPR